MTSETDAEFLDRLEATQRYNPSYRTLDSDRLFALARRGAAVQAERRTGLRLAMVAATLLDQEDLPDEPSAILCGSIDAIRNLAGLLGDPVDVIPPLSKGLDFIDPLPPPPAGETNE